MNPDRLIHMANSIGDFFAAMPDADEARNGIATHIRKFWDPRMRRAMFQHIDQAAESGLHPLVLQALQQHRGELLPLETS
ncbi:formate dehydrogenase subunit delta [Ideonella sp. BN130291]|uniref:formate dehydrogenase subunit delta n=1 Tax=Ideonella sp. BN130291 TaxID=3112940 RepID=UPI002E274672|nr:formate dehydrogenase subunit delta [Ideonella sp. BN130291]